jgi:hypothetical protein
MGTWSELLPFLQQSCTSQRVTDREVGAFMLYTVLENIVEGFQEHLQNFFKIFQQLLVDPESLDVRIATVRCVSPTPFAKSLSNLWIDRWGSSHNILMQTTSSRWSFALLLILWTMLTHHLIETFSSTSAVYDPGHRPMRRLRKRGGHPAANGRVGNASYPRASILHSTPRAIS